MVGHRRSLLVLLLLALAAAACAAPPHPAAATNAAAAALRPLTDVLVFSKTAGYRHSSIPTGVAAISELGRANGVRVTATEDAGQFTAGNLARYQAVVWLSTTGDVLDVEQQAAFEAYLENGGGYVGVHAAADTEYDWPWYGGLVGAWFADHPPVNEARVSTEDRTNPATKDLAEPWIATDEWYRFRTNPRSTVRVLQSRQSTGYTGALAGDRPITWCHDYSGGRAFYTALGHTEQMWADPTFRLLLWGGIRVAARSVAADCQPVAPPTAGAVGLIATVNQRLVTAENAGAAPLIANRSALGPWERFDLLRVAPGRIALRARANGRLVCAEAAGAAPLIANRDAVGAWETFDVVRNPDGSVSLRSGANGRYVVAEAGGAGSLIANRTAVGPWEKFVAVDSDLTAVPL